MQANQDHIRVHRDGGMSFVGRDAVEVYRLKSLRSFINLHKRSGMIPTRGVTITAMLGEVTKLTGKPYKGKTKHDAALADLDQHIAALDATIPVERA